MRNLFLFAGVPLMVAVVVDPLPVRAQVAKSLEHAEVQKRLAAGGQTVSEILATILLNNIKLKHPASRIVALDFGRGAAAVEKPDGGLAVVDFDPTTLQIKS